MPRFFTALLVLLSEIRSVIRPYLADAVNCGGQIVGSREETRPMSIPFGSAMLCGGALALVFGPAFGVNPVLGLLTGAGIGWLVDLIILKRASRKS